MNKLTMQTLARRLDRVERENRRLKRAGLLTIGLLMVFMLPNPVLPGEKPSPEKCAEIKRQTSASAEQVYKLGLKSYIDEKYDLVITSMQLYLTCFQDDPRFEDKAYYWLGEGYYSKGQHLEAIGQFDVVLNKYPNSEKIPSALLKKGYALLHLGDRDRAKAVLDKVVQNFSGTKEAALADAVISGRHTPRDPKIMSYCKRIAGDSYSLMEACIRREEEAKRRLGY